MDKVAYLAGIVDGEGCLTLSHHKQNTFQAIITISNTSKDLMRWLTTHFGGRVSALKGGTQFAWRCEVAAEQKRLLNLILPYLIIKSKQAQILLEFRELVDSNTTRGPVSPENASRRWELYHEVCSLNGPRPGKRSKISPTI